MLMEMSSEGAAGAAGEGVESDATSSAARGLAYMTSPEAQV